MYENEKNPSRVFDIYECLFEFKQGYRSVPEFHGELKNLIDELEIHQSAVTDAVTLREEYHQDLVVSKFLSGLSPSLWSWVRGQILEEDNIPTLTATFSKIMRVSTEADVSHAPSIESSVMVSGRSRGCGRDRIRDFRGRG